MSFRKCCQCRGDTDHDPTTVVEDYQRQLAIIHERCVSQFRRDITENTGKIWIFGSWRYPNIFGGKMVLDMSVPEYKILLVQDSVVTGTITIPPLPSEEGEI